MARKVITNEQWETAFRKLVDEMTPAQILAIPGVYEILSEEMHNDALERAEHDAQEQEASEQASRSSRQRRSAHSFKAPR